MLARDPTYHCELAWLGGDTAVADVAITVDGDRIAAIDIGASPSPDATRLAGLTMPGLANAHSHAFHRALRGRTQRGAGSFWTWRDEMYRLADALDPDVYRALALAVFTEMAEAGITCVGEFHYVHHQPGGRPYDDPNEMGGALIAAASTAGIRITLLDTCYLHGGIGIDPNPTQRRFADADALAWAARATALAEATQASPTARVGAAIHSVRAVDPAASEIVGAWADARRAPLHAHVSEQPGENEQCLAAYGRTPVAVLGDSGVLGDRFTAVHATHVTSTDVDQLGLTGCTCCICPTTERDLADGIGPTRALVDAGARLSLGSDSHAVIDVLEEARAVELDERLATGVRGHRDPDALLEMATVHGHASLGWPDAGRLAVGSLADFVTVGTDSARTATLAADPLGTAVFAAAAADVHHVVVGGRVVVADGQHVSIDVAEALRTTISAVLA